MKYVVRVNSSAQIGTGHLVRSLALAERLRHAGGEVSFVVRPLPGGIDDAIVAGGFTFAQLSHRGTDERRYPWTGVPPAREMEESLSALRESGGADWLIVDNYGLDAFWERAMRAHARGIFAVDDLADRSHDVDALLDQSAGEEETRRYGALLPASARLFMGPSYIQLREQFARRRAAPTAERDGTIRRVLVAFGTEPGKHALLALEALAAVDPGTFEVTAVLAERSAGFERARALVAGRPKWALHSYVESMADVMAASDLAIGAGGTSAYERAAVELPAIAWAIADNQLGVIRRLERAEAIVALAKEAGRAAQLRRLLAELLADPGRVRALAAGARAAMSGWESGVRELVGFLSQAPATVRNTTGAVSP